MSKFFRPAISLLIVAIFLVVSATSASADDSVEEQLLTVFGELSTNIKAADGDCAQVAKAMNDWTDAHAEELTRLSVKMDERMQTLSEEEAKKFEARFTPIIETLIGSAMACAENEDVQKAFENMDKVMTTAAEGEEGAKKSTVQ